MLPGVDHLPHTHLPQERLLQGPARAWRASSPTRWRASSACTTRRTSPPSSSSPCAGSTGYLPPPKGYLERLRQICDKHGILLIFDEVITGFGRLGTGFAAEKFGVIPDLMTVAKGITNATVPMGGVFVRKHVFDGLMNGPENAIDLFHGYTYSAHPLACAAASAVLDIYEDEALFAALGRAVALLGGGRALAEGPAQRHRHPQPRPRRAASTSRREGAVGTRGFEAFTKAFELGLMVRQSGDAIAMSPPLVIEKAPDRRDHRHHRQDDQGGRLAEPVAPHPRLSPGSAASWPRWRTSPSRAASPSTSF